MYSIFFILFIHFLLEYLFDMHHFYYHVSIFRRRNLDLFLIRQFIAPFYKDTMLPLYAGTHSGKSVRLIFSTSYNPTKFCAIRCQFLLIWSQWRYVKFGYVPNLRIFLLLVTMAAFSLFDSTLISEYGWESWVVSSNFLYCLTNAHQVHSKYSVCGCIVFDEH